MKVLVVLTQPPLPEGGAPGRCAVALLRGLRAHGIDVSALAARQPFSLAGDVPSDLPVELVPVGSEAPGWRARVNRLRRPAGALARSALGARVGEEAQRADVVHLEETETSWCGERIATPAVLHVHFLMRLDRRLGLPWTAEGRYAIELALAERAAVPRFRHLVASSPVIASALRKAAPRADVTLAPLALDPQYYPRAPLDGPPVAGIIGTADWGPTAAGIRRLATEVWPLVATAITDARLLVAGRGTSRLSGLDEASGLQVVGEVGSSSAFLRGLSLLLYPLERGSGMKVKVLEALATGLPVVTTPAGAEGILPNDGVVVETEPRRLADAAASILRDAGERQERGAAALRAFEERHTPEPATRPLAELYRRIAS